MNLISFAGLGASTCSVVMSVMMLFPAPGVGAAAAVALTAVQTPAAPAGAGSKAPSASPASGAGTKAPPASPASGAGAKSPPGQPAPGTKSPPGGGAKDPADPAYDPECLKKAINAVKEEYKRAATRFTDDNKAKAKAAYDAAKSKSDAERKRRNSTKDDDDRGYEGNGVSNRDDNFAHRQSGAGRSSGPKMGDYETWAERMKEEVKAERRDDPHSGKKLGPPLIPADHPLAGAEMKAFIDEYRDRITDARLARLIDAIEAKYLEVAKAKAEAEAAAASKSP